jgi:glycosyltransferase involved in cell wall biosynthesis
VKICYVCCEYPPSMHGGIGSVIQSTAQALVENGHEVRVVGIYPAKETAPEYQADSGLQVWRLRESSAPLAWVSARYELFRRIQQWAEKGEIDVVEVPDWEGHASCWPRLKVPVVVRLHGSKTYFGAEMNTPVRKSAFWLESKSFHRGDYCTSCSNYTAEKTRRLFGEHSGPISIIYNSIPFPQQLEKHARDRNSVVFAGTLTRKKGIIQLIRSWSQVHATHPSAELHVYGKDAGTDKGSPMIPYLRSLLSPEARESVHFYGHVTRTQLQSVYQKCRLAVFPSCSEAFAMAPMEAMAQACPVIYSNRSSGPELIRAGCDGLLVDPDNEEEIANSITRLLEDDSLASRVGCAGRETIRDHFGADRMVGRLLEFYSSCRDSFKSNGHKR